MSAPLHHKLPDVGEVGHAQRLEEVRVRACSNARLDHVVLVIGRDHDHRDLVAVPLSYLRENFMTVHTLHHHIAHDEIDTLLSWE